MRDGSAFELVVAGRAKLARAQPLDCSVVTTDPALSCHQFNRVGRAGMDGHSVDTADIARVLQLYLGTPVTDKTGLKGLFDVVVHWSPDDTRSAPLRVDSGEPQPNPGDAGVFTALQEQLGLRLKPVNGSVKVLVIDSAEHPTADDAVEQATDK